MISSYFSLFSRYNFLTSAVPQLFYSALKGMFLRAVPGL